MADLTTEFFRELTSAELDFKSPIPEDVQQQLGRIIDQRIMAMVINDTNIILAGAVDSVSTNSIVDTNPTSTGVIDRDDQFNGLYIHFTSGAAFVASDQNKFKITNIVVSTSTITSSTNLAAEGVLAGDTYVIYGHSHDGLSIPDGAPISFQHLVNHLSGGAMGADAADAVTDPLGNRGSTPDATTPFATIADAAVSFGTNATTQVIGGGVAWSFTVTHGLGRVPQGVWGVQTIENTTSGFDGSLWFGANQSGATFWHGGLDNSPVNFTQESRSNGIIGHLTAGTGISDGDNIQIDSFNATTFRVRSFNGNAPNDNATLLIGMIFA